MHVTLTFRCRINVVFSLRFKHFSANLELELKGSWSPVVPKDQIHLPVLHTVTLLTGRLTCISFISRLPSTRKPLSKDVFAYWLRELNITSHTSHSQKLPTFGRWLVLDAWHYRYSKVNKDMFMWGNLIHSATTAPGPLADLSPRERSAPSDTLWLEVSPR